MIFGLNSGFTVKHTVDRLGELLQPGKVHNIIRISKNTHQQVISLRISLSNLDDYPILDLAIDGADEVDPHLNLVKGRCGLEICAGFKNMNESRIADIFFFCFLTGFKNINMMNFWVQVLQSSCFLVFESRMFVFVSNLDVGGV
ncbi:putative ribose-5-phosphate isomerase [Rosa chinensis]|uniref:ribose-5-phosphate isomerase n=1 Tax=Rosa chinensis TaxID=74649 RepID=A0A2P6RBK3_ROSCH|nr:putative ribose-5-phosphate isomerase [Rosa chinensis]